MSVTEKQSNCGPITVGDRDLYYLTKYYYFDQKFVRKENPTFLMVGAYTKRVIQYIQSLYPTAKILIYEAEPSVHASFVSLNLPGDVTFIRKALSRTNETIEIYKYAEEEASSVFKIGRRKPRAVNTVEGQTLKTILDENGIDHLDCLLMNCEGAELFALEQIADDAGLRDRISQVCTCYHDDHTNVYSTDEKNRVHSLMEKTHDVYDSFRGKIHYYLYTQPKRVA